MQTLTIIAVILWVTSLILTLIVNKKQGYKLNYIIAVIFIITSLISKITI
jgi:hypothetical protein